MKVGIVGAGAVGTSCLYAMALRGSADHLVLVNRTLQRARGVVEDLQYGALLGPAVHLEAGGYEALEGAAVVAITAGANERKGGATDRNDPRGRLKLLATNAAIYGEIVPRIAAVAPEAIVLVVTDPPDPLADVARAAAPDNCVISSGTLLDSLRLRFQVARALGVDARSVDAQVIGEHGTSQVYLWSGASVGGTPVIPTLVPKGSTPLAFRNAIEKAVRFANISIIEGTGASELGIGVVTARIVEMIGRDEGAVVPVGTYHERFGVTLSLPVRIGRRGPGRVLVPAMSREEEGALERSAQALREALGSLERGPPIHERARVAGRSRPTAP